MEIDFGVVDSVMRWVVFPTVGVVIYIYNRQNNHHTDIQVLKSLNEANKTAHDREMKEMRETIKAIFIKLDTIEQALRK
jgi:predicted nucleic acid-binding Zn ribbon protein